MSVFRVLCGVSSQSSSYGYTCVIRGVIENLVVVHVSSCCLYYVGQAGLEPATDGL